MGLQTRFDLKRDGIAEIGKGFAIPKRFELEYDGDDVPYKVEMVVTWDAGRLVCTSLTCTPKANGEEVTGEGLRTLPVAGLIRAGVQGYLFRVEKVGRSTRLVPATLPSLESSEGPTAEALEWVALVYRLAHATKFNPTKAVTDALRLPRSTAARWVMTARTKGLLGPTTEGKAGG